MSSPESGIQVTKASTQAHVRHEKPLDITNNVICTNPHVSHLQESSEISEKENQLQAAGPTHDDTQSPIVLETSDVPGLQLYILKDHMPQSVFELDIDQLISWIQRFQSASSQDYQVTRILDCLQNYRVSCPTLRYLQLIFPWQGASPYIEIKINSKIGWSAKVQLTQMLATDLTQYIYYSSAPAETADRNVA